MTYSVSESSVSLENLAERLENIESLLISLHSNAPYMEDEPFEGESPEGEQQSVVEEVETSVIEPVASNVTEFIDSLGLRYFTGSEVSAYFSRRRGNARNSAPPRHLWNNLARTLKVLDKLRSDLGVPIIITSSYRNEPYNKAVGGVPNSHHCFARAIDFVARGGTPDRWGNKLIQYQQQGIFRGGIGIYRSRNFVHVDTRGWNTVWYG
ncbi:MAG: YcbK family protein [Microcystaceae cyanobacterium]